MQTGIDSARGDVIATLDGDPENHPHYIPRMVARLLDEDLDLVAGLVVRPSGQAVVPAPAVPAGGDRLIGRITGVRLHDYGCTLKVFRTDVLKGCACTARCTASSRRGWRPIPVRRGIKEEVVNPSPAALRQLQIRHVPRPARAAGSAVGVFLPAPSVACPATSLAAFGLVFGALGTAALGYLFIVKVFFGEDIGTRPLLLGGGAVRGHVHPVLSPPACSAS